MKKRFTNLLRIKLPDEIFLASSPFGSGRDAIPELMKHDNTRFDWVIRKRRFVSFFDPRDYATRAIVDLDQVDAVDTNLLAFNDDPDDAQLLPGGRKFLFCEQHAPLLVKKQAEATAAAAEKEKK